jgi:hypothetical protein
MTLLDLENYREFVSNVLPASAFPNPAMNYVCDNCGRDVTEHLHRGQPHVWQPMGPQRYTCRCGQCWLTGAVEWDHLRDWERRRRIRDTLAISVLLAILAFIPATIASFALGPGPRAGATAAAIILVPLILSGAPFWIAVAASIWRTRFRG